MRPSMSTGNVTYLPGGRASVTYPRKKHPYYKPWDQRYGYRTSRSRMTSHKVARDQISRYWKHTVELKISVSDPGIEYRKRAILIVHTIGIGNATRNRANKMCIGIDDLLTLGSRTLQGGTASMCVARDSTVTTLLTYCSYSTCSLSPTYYIRV